jgi:hypothetical protein
MIGGHHVANAIAEYNALWLGLMAAGWPSLVLWMASSRWSRTAALLARMLLGWTRLLTGHVRDALLMTLVLVNCRALVRLQAPAIALGMLVVFDFESSFRTANPIWLETIVERAPMTLDFGHWSVTVSNWTVIVIVALTVFGF